jgi:hypothetical protein
MTWLPWYFSTCPGYEGGSHLRVSVGRFKAVIGSCNVRTAFFVQIMLQRDDSAFVRPSWVAYTE